MLFETLNQLPLFLLSLGSGFILYITYTVFNGISAAFINKKTRHIIDFIMCAVLAVMFIGMNYLINYGQIKLFVILGNITAVLLSIKFFNKPIAKLKSLLYNIKTKRCKSVKTDVGKEIK